MAIHMTPTAQGVVHLTTANDGDVADLVDITTQMATSVSTALSQKAATADVAQKTHRHDPVEAGVQAGTVQAGSVAGQVGFATITFPRTYAHPPVVSLTPHLSEGAPPILQPHLLLIHQVTTQTCTFQVYNYDGHPVPGEIHWVAVGQFPPANPAPPVSDEPQPAADTVTVEPAPAPAPRTRTTKKKG